ncbi:hypothetical protein BJX70DRAFT_23933 [Aspergillus crustosus]
MPVTELAHLHLKNNLPLTHPTNKTTATKLRAGIKAQAQYSNADTYLLTQIEDPSHIYILGKWVSVEQHVQEWIPSARNQEIMGGLGDGVEVIWLQHVDLSVDSALGGSGRAGAEGDERIPYSAPVVAIGRYFISSLDKAGFERTFAEMRHYLEEFQGPRKVVGGWRVDKEVDEKDEAKEEFVQFTGWENVEEHSSFGQTEGFEEFGRIRDFLQGAEIKHAEWTFKA